MSLVLSEVTPESILIDSLATMNSIASKLVTVNTANKRFKAFMLKLTG